MVSTKLLNPIRRYNLRNLRSRVTPYNRPHSTTKVRTIKTKKRRLNTNDPDINNISLWEPFNTYQAPVFTDPNTKLNLKKEWVSATRIKNHLLNDPLLDWLDLYYLRSTVDTTLPQHIQCLKMKQKSDELSQETSKLHVLFDMGNRFEAEVCCAIRNKFPGQVYCVVSNTNTDIGEHSFKRTVELMMEGAPIIEQAMLYNYKNMTFGVADLVVRSDYLNKLVDSRVLTNEELNIKAPKLNGKYYYTVIDIKWTTMILCSDGKLIRNSHRFPAYKGQLAVYNAALGQIQGYTPTTAYVLAKSWKYTESTTDYQGYNCFDLLGHVDYSNFDKSYIDRSTKALKWVRNVRYNGHNWNYNFPPSVPELYPNMNNRFDTPFHHVKKSISNKNHELTEIFMVGVKNRQIAHSNGIYKWSDPECTPQNMGIYGKKVGPIVTQILNINRDTSDKIISPEVINNNIYDWQSPKEIEFYIDYESINGVFYNTKIIDVENSKQENGIIFMVGVGHVDSSGAWIYKSFSMDNYTLQEEKRVIQEFVDYIESQVTNFMRKYNIQSRTLANPSFFHWGHIERSLFRTASLRHGGIWNSWYNSNNWIDFCAVFKDEPIVVKGAKKFGLKEIATVFKGHGLIESGWSSDGPADGLGAMFEATNYYRYMEEYINKTAEQQVQDVANYTKQLEMFTNIIRYNEIDCKVVWEIVSYLRKNNISKDDLMDE